MKMKKKRKKKNEDKKDKIPFFKKQLNSYTYLEAQVCTISKHPCQNVRTYSQINGLLKYCAKLNIWKYILWKIFQACIVFPKIFTTIEQMNKIC